MVDLFTMTPLEQARAPLYYRTPSLDRYHHPHKNNDENIGPRGVCPLPLGIAVERSVHFIWYDFGPSGVRALPLGVAAERSVHYIWNYFSFFFSPRRGCPRVMKFCKEL